MQPTDEIFNDIKKKSIKIWETYDNQFWYVDEKLERIWNIDNIGDNRWAIIGMFDPYNQYLLMDELDRDSNIFIIKMMIEVNSEISYPRNLYFNS